MNYFRESRRCLDVSDYIFYLNKIVGDSTHKKYLNKNDKLAKILLFNLEHCFRYEEFEKFNYTLFVLDHFSKIVNDENDIFRRAILKLDIPDQVAKMLINDYEVYIDAADELTCGEYDETLKSESEVVSQGNVTDQTLEFDEDEIVDN